MSFVSVETEYISILYITLVFTVLALLESEGNQKSVILQYLSGGMWLASGLGQFVAGDPNLALTWGLAYLFIGFSCIFIVAAFYNSFTLIQTRRKAKNPTSF